MGVALVLSGLGQDCAWASASTAPRRIVSINMCTDELLLRLADRDRIASVTWLSQDPRNANMAREAQTIPANHGLAEEVIALKPDLVLAGAYTSRTTVGLLHRVGMNVVELDVPRDLDGVRAQISKVAGLVGEPGRGEAVIRDMDERLAVLSRRAHRPALDAFVLQPNGYTVGRGSLVDDLMAHAGLANLASRDGVSSYAQIPLERVALEKADVLILNGDGGNSPSLAEQTLHHPIIGRLSRSLRLVSISSRLWTCAGPANVDAVETLIDKTAMP
ncbi:hypothetical protein BA190_08720 [Labrys sp. WJW]|nr:hypothetical protein BA190_08720 [Labrys sp. WJW]